MDGARLLQTLPIVLQKLESDLREWVIIMGVFQTYYLVHEGLDHGQLFSSAFHEILQQLD